MLSARNLSIINPTLQKDGIMIRSDQAGGYAI
jgi:hypothetical protein